MTTGPSVVISIVLVLAIAPRAQAQTAEAETLFREGKRLLKAGKIAEACEKFEASERIEPESGTEINLADCWEQLGRTASAWAMFVKAAGSARKEDRAAEARRRAALLKDKLVYLTIEVPTESEIDDLEVKRNDQVVDKALWGQRVPVDPDEHKITASAPKHVEWSSTIKVKSKDKIVVVPKLERSKKRTKKPPVEDTPNPYRGTAIGLGVGGASAIAIASIIAVHSKGLQNDSNALCPDTSCGDLVGVDLNRRARSEALIANIGWGLGGAAVIGAIVAWKVGAKKTDRSVAITPRGVLVGGRF
jgi:hypothetical protein